MSLPPIPRDPAADTDIEMTIDQLAELLPKIARPCAETTTLSEALSILKAKIQETPRTLSDEEIGAVRVLVEALTWQPIETAPKNVPFFLVYTPHYPLTVRARWWMPIARAWNDSAVATHWMPLPAPPEREAIDAARRSA